MRKFLLAFFIGFVLFPIPKNFCQSVSGGDSHSIILCGSGSPKGTGYDGDGELGDGTYNDTQYPVSVNGLTGIIAVAAGGYHSLALKSDGTVWAWGNNGDGELGNGSYSGSNTPAQVSGLSGITAIAAGAYHSLALKNDGTVWAWGYNGDGELGNNNTNDAVYAFQISGLSGIIAIAAGQYHSLAVKNDGTVWAWGGNWDGQLGDGTTTERLTPVQASSLSGITLVAGGGYHSLAIKNDGTVWAWGYGGDGELGNGNYNSSNTPVQVNSLSGITAIAGGYYHSLALKNDGTVWAWGNNGDGELGNGNYSSTDAPAQISSLSGITSVAGGYYHSLAAKNDGTFWAWGNNGNGQLGDGTTTGRNIPVKINDCCSNLPDISFSNTLSPSQCLNMDTTVQTGSSQKSFYVKNPGCSSLNISSVSITNAVFTINPSSGSIPSHDSVLVTVTFAPTILGNNSGTLTIHSNINDTAFCLSGYCVPTPSISVTPASFNVSLGCNSTVTSSIVINNSGPGNLSWQVGGSGNKKILLLAAEGTVSYVTDVQTKLVNTGRFTAVDIFYAQSGTPTLAQLKNYDAVMVWSDNGFYDATTIGNNLADYVDAGGGVVTAIFTEGGENPIYGRFNTDNYWCLTVTGSSNCCSGNQTIGTRYIPNHPILKNVSNFNGGYWSFRPNTNSVISGATRVADWSDGSPLIATRTINGYNRVDLGMFPTSSDPSGDGWLSSTDGATLMANALQWCGKGGASWLSFAPASGTVSSNNSSTVTVTFNSTGLTAGTYTANILVASNDPLHPYDTIPATLNVSGSPKISFNKTCVNFGSLIVSGTVKDSVLVTNTGCDTLKVSSIVATPSVFTVSPTGGNLAPGQSGYIKVTFAPAAVSSYTGTLTFHGNVNDTTVCLSGTGLAPLSISVPLAGNYYHSLAICSVCDDGFAWGYNGNGQLGDNTTTNRYSPVLVRLAGFAAVAAGYQHSLALKSNGTVWAWGYNGYGQLGNGNYNQEIIPVQVNGLTGTTIAVVAGYYHSLALKGDGTVWTWGYNYYGQLGNGTTSQSPTPVQVSGLTGIIAIAGGIYHSIALKNDGTVWTWGYNGYGQLGNGTTNQSTTPVQVSGLSGIIAIAGGGYYSLALKSDGTVWGWGYNYDGELGNGTTNLETTPVQVHGSGNVGYLTGITAIAGGYYHSLALKSDSTVWAWGNGGNGQLGNGAYSSSSSPVQVSGLTKVTAIAAGTGAYHSLAMKSDGSVWAWGYNGYGELGNGTTTSSDVPVQTENICPAKQLDINMPLPHTCEVYDTLILGNTEPHSFKVYNKGCDTLYISSVTSDSTAFTVISFPAKIAPVDSGTITISLTPTIAGNKTANITIHNNDADTTLCVKGFVIPAPKISTDSLLFNETLACVDSTQRILTIKNTGGSNLIYNINLLNPTISSSAPIPASCNPPGTQNTCCGMGISNVTLNSINNTTSFSDGEYHDYTGTQKTILVPGQTYTISVKTGISYAEYVEAWIDFNNNGTFEPGELVMNNLNSLPNQIHTASFTVPISAVKNTAVRMRVGSDYNGDAVPLPCTNSYYGQFEDYTIQLLGWVALSSTSGTIPPSSSNTVAVTFNSKGLSVGTYTTTISISNNDPLDNPYNVSTTLHVVGAGQIALSKNCVHMDLPNDSTMQYLTRKDSLYIKNTGCDTLKVTNISTNISVFSVSPTTVNIPTGDSAKLVVTFAPIAAGTFTGNITIVSNDQTNPSITACLSGYAYAAPKITTDSLSFNETLACCVSITKTLIIKNNGGSNLNYNILIGNSVPIAASCIPTTPDIDNYYNCTGGDHMGIYNVTFNTLNNTTGICDDDYHDYSSTQKTIVVPGQTYTLSVQTGPNYDEDVSVWIDWNNNGTFENGEQVENNLYGYINHTTTVTVPANAVQNTPLRMRVRSDYYGTPVSDPCSTLYYGQTEDYTVMVNDWLSVSPSSGTFTVTPSNSSAVNVKFKSCGLTAGTYTANITVSSNDPKKTIDTISCMLHVTGAGIIALSKNCVHMDLPNDSTMQYLTRKDSLYIKNTGCDTLKVTNISTNISVFSVSPTTVNIPTGDSAKLIVTFAPVAAGNFTGNITIVSNDQTNPSITACLSGYAYAAPKITTDSLSFNETLACCDSITKTLTITNNGGSNLINQITGGGRKIKVAIVAAESGSPSYETDVQTKLMNTGKFTAVDIIDVTSFTPTLAQLQGYDAVLVWNHYSFSNATLLGNNLADYIDAGGGVVTAIFTTGNYSRISGRFDSQNYWAINPTSYGSSSVTLGTIVQPNHPIMKNIVSLSGGGYHATANSIMSGASTIAYWSDGMPLIVTKNVNGHNRVDIGMWPPSDDVTGGGNSWSASTNGALLMANALVYSANASVTWISINPKADTITPGGSDIINVKFKSCGLTIGTYTSNIIVASNDPLKSIDTIPATLHVIGAGKIVLSKTCLYMDSIMQYTSHTDSLYIKNIGCDTLRITNITNKTSIFSVNSTAFKIPIGDSAKLKVTFVPTSFPGPFYDTLTILNNDVTQKVCLSGKSFQRPIISAVPTSFSYTLSCCDSTTVPLTINNTGGSNLICKIQGGGGTAKPKVLIITAGDAGTNAKAALLSTGKFTAADIGILVNPSPLTMAMLAPYNAVLVWTNGSFGSSMVGDTLKKFVDHGGGVIIGTYSFENAGAALTGGIMGTNYSPFSPAGTQCVSGTINLATLPNPNHPIFKNISINPTYWYNCNYSNPSLNSGAILLATDLSGNKVVAENHNGKVVGIVVYPDYLNLANSSTDLMFANALYYVNNNNTWLSLTPTGDTTISSGSSMIDNVKFKSCGLTVGTYTTDITIASNDPLKPIDTIPATLHVVGAPNIVFNKTCLNFGSLFVNTTKKDSVMVTNTGCDTLKVSSIVATPNVFTVTPTGGNLPPGDSGYVKVVFTPTAIATYTGAITFHSNDHLSDSIVCLTGTGIPPPVECHNPNSFNVHFTVCQDSILDTLTICNTGGSNLNYNLWSPFGRSLSFNGSTAYMSNNAPSLPTGSVMTVEAWVYPVSFGGSSYNGIVSWGSSANYSNMILSIQNDGRPSMSTWNNDFLPNSGSTATLNQWNHIACVMNGTSVTLYMNGTPVSTTLGVMPTVQSSNLTIGYTNYSGTYFNGKMDEVRVYNRALSQSEILSSMTNTLTGKENGLKAYWNFDDSTTTDFSSHGNNGTLNGGAKIITPNVAFLPIDSGAVSPANTYSVQVKFKKAGLAFGTQNIPIYLNTNDPLNPSDTVIASVTVDAVAPSPTAGSNSPVCVGNNLSLTASTIASATYSWSGPNGFTSTSQNPVITSATTAASGTYSVTATISGCPQGAAGTTTVIVNPPPAVPTAGSNGTVCSGQTLSLTASTVSGATYSWTGLNGFTSALQNPTIANVTTAAAGTYSVTATVGGCPPSAAGTTSVTINQTPSAPTAGNNSPVCAGNDLSLTASTTGTTYSWTGPNSFSSSSQNPVLTSATTAGTGTYSVTATTNGCASTAGTTTVIVNPPPSAPTAGSNSTVCSGLTLSLTASTISGATYAWSGPNSYTASIQNPTITNITTATAGTYSVTATVGGCPPSSAGTVTVAVNQTPSAPTAGSNSPICVGSDLSLTASSTGTTYSWTGPSSFSSTSQNPTITSITTAKSGTYSVTAAAAGCTGPAGTTTVIVNSPPAAPAASSNSPVCVGNDLSLTANTIAGATYSWSGPNSFSSFTQNPTISTVATVAAGTYSVTATVNGCVGTAGTTTVVVNFPPAVPSAGSNSTVCSGQTLSLTANTISGVTYLWSGPNSFSSTSQNPTIANATTASAGTYSVSSVIGGCPPSAAGTTTVTINQTPAAPTAGSNSPVCAGNDLSLTASTTTGATYSWNGPNGFSAASQNPTLTTATTAGTGTYSVTATVAGCTGPTGTTTAIVNPPPSAPTAGSNSTVCSGQTLSLTASTISGATYTWIGPNSFSAATQNPTIASVTTAASGTYSVTATIGGCPPSVAGITTVTINPTPTAPTAGSNSPVCVGSDLSLTASTTGTTYSWTGPNSFNSSSQNPVITSATTAGTGTYSVTATAAGCTGPSGTITAIVNVPPSTPTPNSNSAVCSGLTLSLTANTISGATYAWTGPNSFSASTQNPTLTNVTTAAAGTYSVTATVGGCPPSTAGTTSATINPTPAAPTAGSNSTVCSGQTLSLTSSTVTGATYVWTGPNSFSASTQNPTITNVTTAGNGTYSVSATASGCPSAVGTTSVTINQTPSAPAVGNNSPICAGQTLSLTASAISGATYAWSGPNSFSDVVQNTTIGSVTTTNAGTYSVTATVGGCIGAAGTTTVVVNPIPASPTAGSNSTVCSGQTLSLTASTIPGATYLWAGPNSFSASTQNPAITNVSTAGNGTYSVTASVSGCGSSAGTTSVTINQTPAAPTAGSNSPVCAGTTLSLTASTISGVTYSWSGPNSFSDPTQNPTIASVSSANAGTYSVTATINGCTGTANTTTVAINPPPAVPTAGSNSTVCSGQTLSLTATTVAGATYSWTGPNSFSAATQNPTIASVTTAASGTYSVTATIGGCPPSSAGITTVTINQTPAAPAAGSNSPVCAGFTLSLTANNAGTTYSWSGPNSFSDPTQNPTIVNVTSANAGTYSVTATTAGCTGAAGTTSVTINSIPAAPTSANQSACFTGTIPDLTATGTNIQWYDVSSTLVFSGSPFTTGQTAAATYTYYATQTINGCASPSTTVTLTINALPSTPVASGNAAICYGNPNPNFTATGTNLKWYNSVGTVVGNGNPFTPTQTAPGVYTFYVTQTNTVTTCESLRDSVKLTINSIAAPVAPDVAVCAGNPVPPLTATGTNIQWYDHLGNPVHSGSPYNTGQTTVGTYAYYVSQTNTVTTCSSPKDTVYLNISTPPTLAPVASNEQTCFGSVIPDLNATTGTLINWYSNAALTNFAHSGNPFATGLTAAGSYTFFATDSTPGCPHGPSDTVMLIIHSLPATPIVHDTASCFRSATPKLIFNGTSVQWYNASLNPIFSGDTLATGQTAVGTYTYFVTQTNTVTACVSKNDTVELTINGLPSKPVALDTAVCSAATIPNLTSTGINVQWYDTSWTLVHSGNPFATGQTTPGAHTYYVTQMNTLTGCKSVADTSVLTIMLSPPVPVANNVAVCSGNPIPSLTSTGTNVRWYSNATLTNLVHTGNSFYTGHTTVGVYTYWATDSLTGCVSSSADSVALIINAAPAKPVANNVTTCYGGSTMLSSTGNNPHWFSDATLINMIHAGNNFNTGQNTVGTYTYYVTDFAAGCGNSVSDTAVLTINPTPLVTANNYSVTINQGSSTVLSAYNAVTYTWVPSIALNSTINESVTASPSVTTTYTVTGTNQYGCSNSTTILVVVNPLGVININEPVQDVHIYPNPALDHFTLEFNSTLESSMEIYLLNMLGEKINTIQSPAIQGAGLMKHKFDINTAGFSEGVYNIQIVTEHGTVNRRVVLVR